jgi:hypothetical protein
MKLSKQFKRVMKDDDYSTFMEDLRIDTCKVLSKQTILLS